MKKAVVSEKLPPAVGPYSAGMVVNGVFYTSGQLPVDGARGNMPVSIEEQTKQSLSNIKLLLEEEGYGMEDVISTTVYLSDMNNFADMNKVYATFFGGTYPVRTCVEVSRLPKDALVEISAIAVKE